MKVDKFVNKILRSYLVPITTKGIILEIENKWYPKFSYSSTRKKTQELGSTLEREILEFYTLNFLI